MVQTYTQKNKALAGGCQASFSVMVNENRFLLLNCDNSNNISIDASKLR